MRVPPETVLDAVSLLVSRGVPQGTAVGLVRDLLKLFSPTPTYRRTAEEQREWERVRKAEQRKRTRAVSQGQPGTGDISLREEVSEESKEETKIDSPRPVSHASHVGHRDKADDWPADFLDQFWNAYPPQRRTEKAKVAKKLALIRKSGKVTWARLMAGLARYAASGDVARGFTKGPMVWLNGGCWDDQIGGGPIAEKGRAQRQPSLLTRIALGIDGEDNDEADRHDGATLDL